MVFIHVYHSKAWLVGDYRDPELETNITTTVTGAATRDPLFKPDPKIVEMMDPIFPLETLKPPPKSSRLVVVVSAATARNAPNLLGL